MSQTTQQIASPGVTPKADLWLPWEQTDLHRKFMCAQTLIICSVFILYSYKCFNIFHWHFYILILLLYVPQRLTLPPRLASILPFYYLNSLNARLSGMCHPVEVYIPVKVFQLLNIQILSSYFPIWISRSITLCHRAHSLWFRSFQIG